MAGGCLTVPSTTRITRGTPNDVGKCGLSVVAAAMYFCIFFECAMGHTVACNSRMWRIEFLSAGKRVSLSIAGATVNFVERQVCRRTDLTCGDAWMDWRTCGSVMRQMQSLIDSPAAHERARSRIVKTQFLRCLRASSMQSIKLLSLIGLRK